MLNTKSISNNLAKIIPRKKVLLQATEIAEKVISKESKYSAMSDKQLLNASYRLIDIVTSSNLSIDNYLIDALALAREAMFREYNQKAYKVQLIGAIVCHFGDFAEMVTGEGKTLTLILAAYANAIEKKGVHIVTVNEYLVQRDAEFAKKALSRLGLTVGYVISDMEANDKKLMYNCDITYLSNSELGFDYLRDNMVTNFEDKMQRGLHYAIVDEGDSVLIDESRVPLIIAGNPDEDVSQYIASDNFVKSLSAKDYVIDIETTAINLNDNGIQKAQKWFNTDNLYDIENSDNVHKIINALKANYVMENGKEYIVKFDQEKQENNIALVDSFTGRILEGRMYSSGLHQALQAKERVTIDPENVTIATITYQSLFRLYKKLTAVSGTALTEAAEFLNVYNLVVVDVPTNKPIARIDRPDYVFASKELKWKYVLADIKKRNAIGQPILVGTVSVEDSELLHKLLNKLKIKHEVLNAKNNFKEAEIIKKAGEKYAVTIATNMAGRGTDIKLGKGVVELGGLYVLGTERNESRRIDNQLRGRSGRQGDPGETRFFISLQDSLFKRFATDKFDKAQFKLGEDVIDLKFFSKLLDKTQKRVEDMNFDMRKNLVDYDYVLSEQRELLYKQRDGIMLNDNIIETIYRMVPHIVDLLINTYRNPENINMMNYDKLTEVINEEYFISKKMDVSQLKQTKSSLVRKTLIKEFYIRIKENYEKCDKKEIDKFWKQVILHSIDTNWTSFLDKVQKLRDGVSLRSYEQKSPLNIYVVDSDRMFHQMSIKIAKEVLSIALTREPQAREMNLQFNEPKQMINVVSEPKSYSTSNIDNVVNDILNSNNESNKLPPEHPPETSSVNDNIEDIVNQIFNEQVNQEDLNSIQKQTDIYSEIKLSDEHEAKIDEILDQVNLYKDDKPKLVKKSKLNLTDHEDDLITKALNEINTNLFNESNKHMKNTTNKKTKKQNTTKPAAKKVIKKTTAAKKPKPKKTSPKNKKPPTKKVVQVSSYISQDTPPPVTTTLSLAPMQELPGFEKPVQHRPKPKTVAKKKTKKPVSKKKAPALDAKVKTRKLDLPEYDVLKNKPKKKHKKKVVSKKEKLEQMELHKKETQVSFGPPKHPVFGTQFGPPKIIPQPKNNIESKKENVVEKSKPVAYKKPAKKTTKTTSPKTNKPKVQANKKPTTKKAVAKKTTTKPTSKKTTTKDSQNKTKVVLEKINQPIEKQNEHHKWHFFSDIRKFFKNLKEKMSHKDK